MNYRSYRKLFLPHYFAWLLWLAFSYCLTISLLISCGSEKPAEVLEAEKSIPKDIDYNFNVKPILSDKCFACHGPDAASRKANLRLDTEEGAYATLSDKQDEYAIVPKSLSQSHAFLRMISADPEIKMPPLESNLTLSAKEIAIISRWIEQGAEYKPHWSFIKPEKPVLPEVNKSEWTKNPIDHFVLKRLEEEGISPAQKADKETLVRRLYFDITGLPPSLKEIDNFLADDSPGAYAKLVDSLLNIPSYGERMATNWLDVARYADSDGYLDDKHRDFSPWRDWVIKAFNENMPYDQFVTWQLAGDQIPNPTQESILATAFNRLHKKNSEAGIVFEEYRVEYVADRVETLGKAMIGLSLECARCHDHKYDPISQKDFYKVFGFFNSTKEIGTPVYGPDQTPGPSLLLTSQKKEKIIKFLETKATGFEKKMADRRDSSKEEYKKWRSRARSYLPGLKQQLEKHLVAHYPFDQAIDMADGKTISPNKAGHRKPAQLKGSLLKQGVQGKAFFVTDYNSVELGEKVGWYDRVDPFSVSLWLYPDKLYDEAGIFFHNENLRVGYKGYSLHMDDNRLQFIMAHSWPYNSIQVTTKEPIPIKEWTQVTITYDGSSKAEGVCVYINGQAADVDIDHNNLYKGILYEYDIHTYGFEGFTLGQKDKIVPFKDGGFDELKVFEKALTPLEVLYAYNPTEASKVLKGKASFRNDKLLKSYYIANYDLPFQALRDSLKNVRIEINRLMNSIPEIMVMGDLDEPRPTYVLERGVYDARGEEVAPGVPEAVLPFDEQLPSNRYGLSRWLFDKDNPLTARVYVNRIWQLYFGQGIVKTSDDFGNQGALPTHPKLLDWLAVTFIESGWDIKALHKLIVMSATYQQSSVVTPALAERDPENLLLARGSRYRLPAEMIRDNALAISGLLVDKIGGKSTYPYQPEGLWDEISDKSWRYKYMQEPGEGLYRRSLYTIRKRSSPPPSMQIFDAPDRGVCVVKRRKTSSPLQALVLLNDPQYLEASRVLAERMMQENPADTTQQLILAFRLITGRKPDKKELKLLSAFYKSELYRFKKNPEDANAYLNIGASERKANLNAAPLAALATTANSIMNTSEAYTKK